MVSPSHRNTTTHDLTDLAQPVLAISPNIDQVIGGYHHQDRFFFADEQVADIAAVVTGRILARGGTGWRLRGTRPSTVLPRVWICGQMHYEFPDDWQWRRFALPRQPSAAGRS